jgi:alpha/beta hydrolase fold
MIVDRLDPVLRQFAATRTDLSASVPGVVRDSLNQRLAEASRDVDTVGVDIENREARSIPVRIYRGGPAPAPAVIYCHSGAFVLGNLDTDHRQCVEFARRGHCTVISVDYRLAPEDPYPAGLDDAAAVLAWVADNGANLASTPPGRRSRAAVQGQRWRRCLLSAPPMGRRHRLYFSCCTNRCSTIARCRRRMNSSPRRDSTAQR